MPAPGDQHSGIVNPFEESQKRISVYTAQEIATLQSRLEKQLGPEYLSSRAGPSGQKVHYIAAEKCIALANEVFGFNGWSSSIQNIQVDFVDEHPQTLKISLGLSVIVRVTLRDGTYHEDIGYGHIENCKGKAAAFEKAKKEGTTDGLKRALRNFGNVLGNCIYDKTYLAKVTKLKVAPTKFDESALHRHSDFAVKKGPAVEVSVEVVKVEPAVALPPQLTSTDSFEDFLGELDEADFNLAEDGHPDEVVLSLANQPSSNERSINQPATNNTAMQPPSRPLARSGSGGNNFQRQPHTPNQQPSPRPITNSFSGAQNSTSNPNSRPPQQQFNQNRPKPPHQPAHHSNNNNQPPQPQTKAAPPAPQPIPVPAGETVGFFSARAVKGLPEESLNTGFIAPKAGQVFNPRAESPSIRKTPGIDHTKSKPLARNGQHVPPPSQEPAAEAASPTPATNLGPGAGGMGVARPGMGPPMARGNIVNPQFDQTRRIGAPGMSSSPLGNRGQYKPPTMKRPPPPAGDYAGRAPLADVSNKDAGPAGVGGAPGPDPKRQRIG
ncbi:hypothetical protein B0T25DRAFT_531917 [Lasiosphaeria hispida]|uniref:RAD52 homolog n=1 Tax=Lasiosphaeria hispida TaxID=260671 RepID=A0AAJ0HPP9_9PEZI|nr:hypothetical protein B0T25DRAFT_531917 [Lasiosphaeria hispida]